MKFAIDHGFDSRNRAVFPPDSDSLMPDWQGLRARFSAAHAAMAELRQRQQPDVLPHAHGSFDAASARLLGAFQTVLSSVNPIILTHGKLVDDISAVSAEASKADG